MRGNEISHEQARHNARALREENSWRDRAATPQKIKKAGGASTRRPLGGRAPTYNLEVMNAVLLLRIWRGWGAGRRRSAESATSAVALRHCVIGRNLEERCGGLAPADVRQLIR